MRTSPDMSNPATDSTNPGTARVICVLGMHRSGTSCLMGSLQKAGVHLGKHHTWNKYNQRGNRENQDIVDLNDEVLKYSGGSWDSPPRQLRFTDEHLERARAIVVSFPPDMHWGFKDPRVLFTLPLWERAFDGDYQRIGIFRHPLAVAASLGFREGSQVMPEERALEIWTVYNRRLVQEHRRRPFPLLCFDWPEELFHERLNREHEALGLPPVAQDNRFYNAGLKNYDSRDKSIIPWKQRRLYSKLLSLAA